MDNPYYFLKKIKPELKLTRFDTRIFQFGEAVPHKKLRRLAAGRKRAAKQQPGFAAGAERL